MSFPDERITYVFVTGCRRATRDEARSALTRLGDFDRKNAALVHGGASGIDAEAAYLVRHVLRWRGGDMVVPARWDALSHGAGPERNGVMVRLAEVLRSAGYTVVWLAFPSPKSKGTWNCTRQAQNAGFDVEVRRLAGGKD